jgi:DNA invertase Pin-like site-specific DNA recombinase
MKYGYARVSSKAQDYAAQVEELKAAGCEQIFSEKMSGKSANLHELDGLGCGFVSLREGWCDTTTSAGRLMMTIMGGIAQFEREMIRSRCEEGIERAKRKGTRFGRPDRLDDGEKRMIAERYAKGETLEQLAEEYECGVATVWRALRPFEASASV